MEQRAVINFSFKSGNTATEAYRDLKNVYDDVGVNWRLTRCTNVSSYKR
jgi:hypothetical protein